MYSRWTSSHVRRLFVPISQRFPQGVHLSQVHHPSRNVNYRKEIGALDSFVGALDSFVGALETSAPPERTSYNNV